MEKLRKNAARRKGLTRHLLQKEVLHITEMNIRLKEVLSQIHGASGLTVIKSIIEGERLKKRKSEQILKICTETSLSGLYATCKAPFDYHRNENGITDYTWLQLYAEVGKDLSKWKSEKHFTSWAGLAPGQHQSGKMKKSKNKKYKPKAGQIFRQISQSLIESKKIALGSFGRRIKSKRGPGIAVKATARKLAVLYWRLMVKGLDYTEKGIKAYEEKMKLQKERWLQKTANDLGYQLIDNVSFR
jgi:transposase